MMSACVDRAETIRSRILLRVAGGICEAALDHTAKPQLVTIFRGL